MTGDENSVKAEADDENATGFVVEAASMMAAVHAEVCSSVNSV